MLLRRLSSRTSYQYRRFFSSKNNSHDLSSTITEFNKEMEMIFGESPSTSYADSFSSPVLDQEPEVVHPVVQGNRHQLTHIDSRGESKMVDVSSKESTKRSALASCKVILGKKVFDLVSANQLAKGDVLSVAKIAGIAGAKQTSNLIPLCHNISLTHVVVDLALNPSDHSVEIRGEAATTGKTGVEMEALTAVSIAALTVYDMCKAASKDIVITNTMLERKTGGKSGVWSRESDS